MSDVQYFRIAGQPKKDCNKWLKRIYLPGFDMRNRFLEANFPGFQFKFKGTKRNHRKPCALRGEGDLPRGFKHSKVFSKTFNPNSKTKRGRDAFNCFDEFEYEYQPTMVLSQIVQDTLRNATSYFYEDISINYFLDGWYVRIAISSLRNTNELPSYLIPVHAIDYHSRLVEAKESNSFVLLES